MSTPLQAGAYAEGRRAGRAECAPVAESLRSMLAWCAAYRDIVAHPDNLGPDAAEVGGMDRKLATARERLAEFDKAVERQ